jgi:Polyketide cyclase / dehydrase and lipid transport
MHREAGAGYWNRSNNVQMVEGGGIMMTANKTAALCVSALAIGASAGQRAAAEVVSSAPNGFEVRGTVHVVRAPDKAYAALLQPATWWSSDHTFSGSAANLSLDARAGGCWCESLPDGGSVEHMRVVYVAPGKIVRLRGALGPFQGLGVDGAMTWSVKAAAGGADISFTYTLGGYAKEGFDGLSKAADRVLGEQLERLRKLIDGQV